MDTNGGGRGAYSPLAMFKLMLLDQRHSVSDTRLKHALKLWLSFVSRI